MVQAIVQESVSIVPEGIYKARLDKWSEVKSREYPDKDNPNQKITKQFIDGFWKIVEGDQKDKLVKENFSLYISSNSELGKMIEKFTGAKITPGETIDLDKLIGIQAQLTIEIEEKTSKTGGKFQVNVIKSKMKVSPQ